MGGRDDLALQCECQGLLRRPVAGGQGWGPDSGVDHFRLKSEGIRRERDAASFPSAPARGRPHLKREGGGGRYIRIERLEGHGVIVI